MSVGTNLTVDQVTALVEAVQAAGVQVKTTRDGTRIGPHWSPLQAALTHLEKARESLWTLLGMVLTLPPSRSALAEQDDGNTEADHDCEPVVGSADGDGSSSAAAGPGPVSLDAATSVEEPAPRAAAASPAAPEADRAPRPTGRTVASLLGVINVDQVAAQKDQAELSRMVTERLAKAGWGPTRQVLMGAERPGSADLLLTLDKTQARALRLALEALESYRVACRREDAAVGREPRDGGAS